jgi:hypothetical protein
MSASQAPHATPHGSLSGIGQKPADEKGWLSRATYDGLPARFQAIARELAAAGEIEIERSTRMNEGSYANAIPV